MELLFVPPAPFPALPAVISPASLMVNSVPAEPAKLAPSAAPNNFPIQLPASLTITSHQVPPEMLELAMFKTWASIFAFPVVIDDVPLVLRLGSLSPGVVPQIRLFSILGTFGWGGFSFG